MYCASAAPGVEQFACDDQFVDFGRALVNTQRTDVAIQPFRCRAVHDAAAAE